MATTATITNIRELGGKQDRWHVEVWGQGYGPHQLERQKKAQRTFERNLEDAIAWAQSWLPHKDTLSRITIDGKPAQEALKAWHRGNPVIRHAEEDMAALKTQRDELLEACKAALPLVQGLRRMTDNAMGALTATQMERAIAKAEGQS